MQDDEAMDWVGRNEERCKRVFCRDMQPCPPRVTQVYRLHKDGVTLDYYGDTFQAQNARNHRGGEIEIIRLKDADWTWTT